MFLDFSLGKTDLRTIKDVPSGLCKELALPVAASRSALRGRKGVETAERLQPVLPPRQAVCLLHVCVVGEFT